MVEDSELDARLVLRELRRAGFAPKHERVTCEAQLRDALRRGPWDVVLSDHALPGFNSTLALAVLDHERAAGQAELEDLPFIIVSGAIRDETAIEAMRSGARDYILKYSLGRLAPAIERELRETQIRRERRGLEAQLQQAQKMESFGRLAGGVAHDFNNLLTCVVGYATLLERSLDLADNRRGYLEDMLDAARRGAGLTHQLLAFSRRQMLSLSVTSLNGVVADTEKLLRRIIGEDVQLRTELAADLGSVQVDVGQMQQVVINLAINARDAMPRGGVLTLATYNLDGDRQVALAVSDTGVGMTREVMRHLYEPFFTTKGPRRGSGLGLSTAYGIVQQSGGTISCTSEPGRGTTFVIALPRVAAVQRVAEVAPQAPVIASEGGHETVLLVEDEEAVRKVAQEVLELRGYRVLAAPDAAAALNRAESHPGPIELLLTDLVLPDMNGRDLAERVRAARPASRVLYTSGYTDEIELLTAATGAGALFLPKPYDPAGLLRSVREVLGAPLGAPAR